MNGKRAGKPTLLLVDDEFAVHDPLAQILRLEGFAVRGAMSLEEALRIADAEDCDLVLTDLSPTGPRGSEGLVLLDALRARRPSRPVALFTARGTPEILAEARRCGAADAWGKDIPIEEMVRRLRRLMGGRRRRPGSSARSTSSGAGSGAAAVRGCDDGRVDRCTGPRDGRIRAFGRSSENGGREPPRHGGVPVRWITRTETGIG